VFTQGFARKYRLTDCDVIIEAFDSTGSRDAAAYRDACLAASRGGEKPNLALATTSGAQEDLQGDESSYLVAKSVLMGQGVPGAGDADRDDPARRHRPLTRQHGLAALRKARRQLASTIRPVAARLSSAAAVTSCSWTEDEAS
jgi:hypothetical protein